MAYSAFEQKQIPNASTTVAGSAEEATVSEVAAGTEIGGSGAKLFVTPGKLGYAGQSVRLPAYESITAGDVVGISRFSPTSSDYYDNIPGRDSAEGTITNTTWVAQRFTIPATHTDGTDIYNTNALYFSVTTTTVNGFTFKIRSSLTGADIISTSNATNYGGAWQTLSVGTTSGVLIPGTTYYLIVLENSGTSADVQLGYIAANTNPPPNGEAYTSSDSGATWTPVANRNYLIKYNLSHNAALGHMKVFKSSAADLGARFGFAGYAGNSASAGQEVTIVQSRQTSLHSGLTPNKPYFLSNTNGAISLTPGTNRFELGRAYDSTTLVRYSDLSTPVGAPTLASVQMPGIASIEIGSGATSYTGPYDPIDYDNGERAHTRANGFSVEGGFRVPVAAGGYVPSINGFMPKFPY